PQGGDSHQHLHVGQRPLPCRLREESYGDLPWQSIFHDNRESWPIHSDGLPQEESRDHPLSRRGFSCGQIKKPRHWRGFWIQERLLLLFLRRLLLCWSFFLRSHFQFHLRSLLLFTTIAHLLWVSSLIKTIFKTCHTKIQN